MHRRYRPTAGASRFARRGGFRLALLVVVPLALQCLLLSPVPADAAPAIYYKVPGGASEGIYDLTTGGDGTLWVLQQEGEGARVLHLDGSGNLIAASPPLESVGEIASDGGESG